MGIQRGDLFRHRLNGVLGRQDASPDCGNGLLVCIPDQDVSPATWVCYVRGAPTTHHDGDTGNQRGDAVAAREQRKKKKKKNSKTKDGFEPGSRRLQIQRLTTPPTGTSTISGVLSVIMFLRKGEFTKGNETRKQRTGSNLGLDEYRCHL
jgi:hypothetical protein